MKEKNIMVKVARYNTNLKDFEDIVVHINECTEKDKQWARCPECDERVKLMLKGDKHYEHEMRAGKACRFKTVEFGGDYKKAYLFAWNSDPDQWGDYDEILEEFEDKGFVTVNWRTSRKNMEIGETAFLIKLGTHPRGIIGMGTIMRKPVKRDEADTVSTVEIKFNKLLNYNEGLICKQEELKKLCEHLGVDQNWSPQNSGTEINSEVVPEILKFFQSTKKTTLKPSWKELTEKDILISLQDLEKQKFNLGKVLEKYQAINEAKTRFVEYRGHFYGLKLVFQHAYFLKFGTTNEENETSDYYDSLIRSMNSSHWNVIKPSIALIEKNLYEPENFEDEIVMRPIRERRGQSEFRKKLLEVYKGKCCVTGCTVESILDAAHIIPHAEETNYNVTNGLLLRTDIHTLFDLKMLKIDKDFTISICDLLKGTEYETLNGKRITLPDSQSCYPAFGTLEKKAG